MRICHYTILVDVFYEPQTYDRFKERGNPKTIQSLFICVTMRVKHISLIHIVNKSSTFNISEFVIVLFYCIAFIIIIIIVINDNEPKAFV